MSMPVKHLPAANQSLQLLGRHLAMFTERVELSDVRGRARVAAVEAGLDPDEVEREALKLLAAPR
jgi:hypothetical protein